MSKEFLDAMEVDTDGKPMSQARRESFPDAIILQKRTMAKEKREIVAAKTQASKEIEKVLLNEHSIFSGESSEEDARFG